MFGININLTKSKILGLGNVEDSNNLRSALGGRLTTLLIKYLGLPLHYRFKEAKTWESIVERIVKRLAGWKRTLLSREGDLH